MRKIRVLLAEKDDLVTTDLAVELENSGLTVSAMTSSCVSALKVIDENSLDFALLNVELLDGASYPVAKRLKALGIPFVFFTSFEKSEIDLEFQDVPRLAKPQAPRLVADFVAGLLNSLAENPAHSAKTKGSEHGHLNPNS